MKINQRESQKYLHRLVQCVGRQMKMVLFGGDGLLKNGKERKRTDFVK